MVVSPVFNDVKTSYSQYHLCLPMFIFSMDSLWRLPKKKNAIFNLGNLHCDYYWNPWVTCKYVLNWGSSIHSLYLLVPANGKAFRVKNASWWGMFWRGEVTSRVDTNKAWPWLIPSKHDRYLLVNNYCNSVTVTVVKKCEHSVEKGFWLHLMLLRGFWWSSCLLLKSIRSSSSNNIYDNKIQSVSWTSHGTLTPQSTVVSNIFSCPSYTSECLHQCP